MRTTTPPCGRSWLHGATIRASGPISTSTKGSIRTASPTNDGSWWRAFRYKPFPGTFWPTNGSTDDILIRLLPKFRKTADGADFYEIYRLNLSLLEAAIAVSDTVPDDAIERTVEPLDETLAKVDLNGDGVIGGRVTKIRGLPARYLGLAADEAVQRHLYPPGTEFLHTVRHVDPNRPNPCPSA